MMRRAPADWYNAQPMPAAKALPPTDRRHAWSAS